MKILVTGANGFLGKHFCKINSNLNVVPLVRSLSNCFNDKCVVYDGSIQSLVEAMRGVDVVLHLATYYVAQHGQDDIPKLIQSNVEFGNYILHAMDKSGVNKIVNVGTVWQKHNGEDHRYVNLYAATKQAFTEILSWYCDAKGFLSINLHLSDTYGPGDTRRKLVDLLIDTALNGNTLDMSGGYQEVELTHVIDVVNAFKIACELVEKSAKGKMETYSLLDGKALNLRSLAKMIGEVVKKPLNINWGGRPYREREVMSQPSAVYKTLPGWSKSVPLQEGILSIIESVE